MADEPKPEEKKPEEKKTSLLTTAAMWGVFILILIILISSAWNMTKPATQGIIEPSVVIAKPAMTPTPAPAIFDVNQTVKGRTYEVEWGEMLYQYSRDVSFYNMTNPKGENIFFGTFFDFAANSAQRPSDRPGIQLQGGVWRQNRSEITLDYSTTYDHSELVKFQTGNVSRYQYHETFRCLDTECKNLSGVFGTYTFLWDDGDLKKWTTTNMSYVGTGVNMTDVYAHISANESSVNNALTAISPNLTGG